MIRRSSQPLRALRARRTGCKRACLLLLALVVLAGCGSVEAGTSTTPDVPARPQVSPAWMTPARAQAGAAAIDSLGCTSCHMVPGVVGKEAYVGPPLQGIAERRYLAGVLLNTPDNMVEWIRHPQRIDPLTAMPDLRVSREQARSITAYLHRESE